MNTLVAVAIAPFGVGDELSAHVAEAVRIIRESGLRNETHSMFTEIEGEWDEVFDVIKRATEAVMPFGARVGLVVKADIRPGRTGEIDGKLERLERAIESGD